MVEIIKQRALLERTRAMQKEELAKLTSKLFKNRSKIASIKAEMEATEKEIIELYKSFLMNYKLQPMTVEVDSMLVHMLSTVSASADFLNKAKLKLAGVSISEAEKESLEKAYQAEDIYEISKIAEKAKQQKQLVFSDANSAGEKRKVFNAMRVISGFLNADGTPKFATITFEIIVYELLKQFDTFTCVEAFKAYLALEDNDPLLSAFKRAVTKASRKGVI